MTNESHPRYWDVIEYDPNTPYPRDIVTADYAADLEVGQEIMVVMIDTRQSKHEGRSSTLIDDAHAVLCRITKIQPLDAFPGEVLVTAEVISHND